MEGINSNSTKEENPLKVSSLQAKKEASAVTSSVAKAQIQADRDRDLAKIDEKLKAKGWVGVFLGGNNHISKNIAALTIIILIISGIIYTLFQAFYCTPLVFSVKDFWLTVTPFITAASGYLFGAKKDD